MLSGLLQNLRLIGKIGLRAYLRGHIKFLRYYFLLRDTEYRGEYLSGQYKRGRLKVFAENDAEGLIWAVYEDGKKGCEGLSLLRPGDYLAVFGHDSQIIFQGTIDPDPEIRSRWWTQLGWKPEDWAELFYQPVPYRALLFKKEVPKSAWRLRVESRPPIKLGEPVSKP